MGASPEPQRDDGVNVTKDMLREAIQFRVKAMPVAAELFDRFVTADHFDEFLTLEAYKKLD